MGDLKKPSPAVINIASWIQKIQDLLDSLEFDGAYNECDDLAFRELKDSIPISLKDMSVVTGPFNRAYLAWKNTPLSLETEQDYELAETTETELIHTIQEAADQLEIEVSIWIEMLINHTIKPVSVSNLALALTIEKYEDD